MARRYMTATQEWAADYERLHARPGKRGPVRLSGGGARILKMLKPYPWEPGSSDVEIDGDMLTWTPAGDSFVVGHAHDASLTGFPSGDAKRILDAFSQFHGSGRSKPPRYVVYVDGTAQRRWEDRDEASLDAERAVAGRPGMHSGVKDTHTGRWVARFDNRREVPVDWEPSREVKGQQGTMVLGGGEGLGLFRRSRRRRYRNR
jgi:hypothetical protein